MILWTIQLNSFHSNVGVNRNAVNTLGFTSSVAGTTNLSAASGSRIQTFPLPQTCILSARRALCKHAVLVCELTIGFSQCVFRICSYTPMRRPWWVTTATERLNSLRVRLVDFVVRERSLGFSPDTSRWFSNFARREFYVSKIIETFGTPQIVPVISGSFRLPLKFTAWWFQTGALLSG